MISIADHLRALVRDEDIPAASLTALVERIPEAGPPLHAVLAKAADGKTLSDDEATLFFYGLHILAAARDHTAFQPLLRFLRRPDDEIADLLGDADTVTLPRVAASLFDGDVEGLLTAVRDQRIEQFVRDALFGAATFLTWDGRIPLDRTRAFLVDFEVSPSAPDGDLTWFGWVQAISLLGLRDMLPAAERVFAAQRLPENVMELRDFEQDLRDAERDPTDRGRFEAANLGYIDDVVEALRWIDAGGDDEMDLQPIVNPHRDVGRNDPCPCGSGKKYKKCCLANA